MSRVPGTFKSPPPLARRIVNLGQQEQRVEALLRHTGALVVQFWLVGECGVIVTREPLSAADYRWHLSISHPSRYPTWDEIKTAVYGIDALDGVTMAQVLGPVADGEWVNLHDNCFHLYELHDDALEAM